MAQMLAPKTTRICPLMSADAGAARKATTLAMFLGSQASKAPSSALMPLAAEERLGHAGAGPGRDRVGRHAVAAELAGLDQGQRRDARLGGGVVGLARVAEEAGLRRTC